VKTVTKLWMHHAANIKRLRC